MFTILVADDDPIMLGMVERLLSREGYQVIKAGSAEGVVQAIDQDIPDLLVIDMNLPDRNGLLLCKELRQREELTDMPIIFLTGAATSPDDVAQALNSGGDDYIHKPFVARVFSARVRAHLRRLRARRESNIVHIQLHPVNHEVVVDERVLELTRVEYNLMRYMCKRVGEWVSTRDLLAEVWRYPGNVGDSALVRNHIRNLRRKVEPDPDHPRLILSRHRRGYMLVAKIDTQEAVT